MPERRPAGRRARWSAAFVVAPTAAAVFAATTAWSAAHDPTPAAPGSGSAGSDVTAQQNTLDDQAARVTALQAQLAQLRAEAASLGSTTGKPVKPAPGSAGGGTARASTGGSTRGSTGTRASGTTRTTTPAPAVHAVTGGS